MVEKRRTLITHIILWILIPIILFPIVWVVSTSIRRDEAAFSTKLFSSRITLQNYIDLLAPEKNMPVLVQEIQNLILKTPPYDTWSDEKIEKQITSDLQGLKGYLKETEERYNNANINFDKIRNIMTLKEEEIKNKTISILKELKDFLEKNVSSEGLDKEKLKVSLYQLLENEKYNSEVFNLVKKDLEKLLGFKINSEKEYKNALLILRQSYEKHFGDIHRKLEDISNKIEENRLKEEKIKERYRKIQDNIIALNNTINNEIKDKISFIEEELKSASTSNIIPATFYNSNQNSVRLINSLIGKLSKFYDFNELVHKLSNISNIIEKNPYLDSKINKEIDLLYAHTSSILEKLSENIKLLQDEEKKLAQLKDENEFLEMQKELEQGEEEQKEEDLKPTNKYEQVRILIEKINELINSIENTKGIDELVKYCAPIESDLRDFATSYIIDFGKDDIATKIESTADRLKWFNDYQTFIDKYFLFSSNLNNTLEKFSSLLNNLENQWRYTKDSVRVLDELYSIIKTDFVNLVSANMNVVSKKAGDLMDIIPYGELKGYLNRIDAELFRIDQIWKQKTKHYFLRWVRNSIVVAGVSAIITTLICSLAAYPFSRLRFLGRKYGILALLLIQMFPSAVYMIAIYTLLNLLGRFLPFLGLDTLSGLTFVYLGNIAYNMYLIKGYYDTIPDSLEESAMIDGATRFQTFYKIVLPLARPILTVVVILTFMNVFNEFIFARIILQDAKNYTYAIGLWTFSSGPYLTEWGLFTSAALLGMLPMTILFLSLQKYIVSGLTKGAVKG